MYRESVSSTSYNIGKLILLFHGVILVLYRNNLEALGVESMHLLPAAGKWQLS
jgi:hypothetical protein